MTAVFCPHDGKVKFPSMAAAERALRGANRRHKGRSTGHPYKCVHCHGFHFTSMWQSSDAQRRKINPPPKKEPK